MRNSLLSKLGGYHTVEALVRVAAHDHVVAEDIQHPDHLAENENAVPILPQSSQELVEQHHLPAAHNKTLQRLLIAVCLGLSAVEKVRVIRCFLQLHDWAEPSDTRG